MAKTTHKVTREQYDAAQGVLANYDRGTASPGDIVHRILAIVHGDDAVEIDGYRSMEEQYADSVASAQSGHSDQRPSDPHRPQVVQAATLPDLPAGVDLPLETGDAVLARQRQGDQAGVANAGERPAASTPNAVAEEVETADGKQMGTVAGANPARKTDAPPDKDNAKVEGE